MLHTHPAIEDPVSELRFRKFRGLFVVVLGPDGSGKSTILEAARTDLSKYFVTVDHYHWRPGLLPKLGRSRTSKPANTAGTPPPKTFSYGRLISLFRYLYYLADFILGYYIKIYPCIRKGGLVIVERWHHDSILNPERYGFNIPGLLLRSAHRIVPSPALVIVLRGDPEILHARKPELTPGEIQSQICDILNLVPRLPNSVHIHTDQGLETSTNEFISSIKSVANANNLSISGSWRAFPPVGRPRLWISRSNSLASLGDLYTPRSTAARVVTAVARKLPKVIYSRRLGLAEQFLINRVWPGVNDYFNNPANLSLDFYIGTPGPHQKLTARIADGNRVLGYCKAGPEAGISALLDNEGKAETFIDNSAAQHPKTLRFETRDHWVLLISSPPPGETTAWPIEVQEIEVRFLESLLPELPAERSAVAMLDELEANPDSLTPRQKHVYVCSRNHLQRRFEKVPVLTGFSHGDFTPWNMRKLPEGKLFLFDWEYCNPSAPVLTDLLHRIFSIEWLIRRSDALQIIHRLLSLPGRTEFQGLFEKSTVTREMFPAYILLYLLGMLKRKSQECEKPPEIIIECIHLILIQGKDPEYRPRILVSAYACEPGEGSEPGVGWHWTSEISKFSDAWVITRSNNREAIESALRRFPNKHLNFIYTDLPPWLRRWKKQQRGVRTYYYLWQFAALASYWRASRQVRFDMAHHVTFVNDWLWTFLALTRIPFVWGPIGSHPPLPLHLIPDWKHKALELARRTIQNGMRIIDPLFWLSAARARIIVGINSQVSNHFPLRMLAGNRFSVEPAIAIDVPETPLRKRHASASRILFVGRFAPVKAAHLAIESFALLAQQHSETTLTMIGHGPTEHDLHHRIARHGLEDRIHMLGWMPREEVRRHMVEADIFLFPSLEGGGLVVLEAMAAGLPVVCLDYGGPGSMVTDSTGRRIPLGTESSVSAGLAEALAELVEDRDTCARMGSAARNRALENFSWNAKQNRAWYFYLRAIFGDKLQY